MKIGILTLPLHVNYGGILQAYALQTVLERMGHKVRVISRDIVFNLTPSFWIATVPSRLICRLCHNEAGILDEFHYNIKQKKIRADIEPTIRRFVHRDKRYLERIGRADYDCIVVGSDQIWRPKYIQKILKSSAENAFAGFAKDWNIKLFSYAASFGTDEWEFSLEQTKMLTEIIKKYEAVSVREKSGQVLCKEYLDVIAEHVLDPTLLLTKEDYMSAFHVDCEPKNEGNLLSYILDSSLEKKALVDRVANDMGLVPFAVDHKYDAETATIEECVRPSLQKWIRGFYDADFVVTDSYHGCIFSILFGKPFIAIGNAKRGLSRFESLLGLFDLKKNLIIDVSMYDKEQDFSIPVSAYQKLESWREKSLSFLISHLS